MRLFAAALLFISSLTATPAVAGAKGPDAMFALAAHGAAISKRTGGSVAFAALHIESGQIMSVNGKQALALYSVFKLPVAVTVLRESAAGRLDLDRKVHIDPKDALTGGSPVNDDRWAKPVDTTVRELIGWSIVYSDNTSVDKLLEILGGTEPVQRTMKELGFPGIEVKSTIRATRAAKGGYPNVANAEDLALFLGALHTGKLLKEPQRDVLIAFMNDAVTGVGRIRGDLPKGTKVADKTGTGPATANDVGIVTLPDDGGHLAIVGLITDSKLPMADLDKAIAEFARAAYDVYAPGSVPAK